MCIRDSYNVDNLSCYKVHIENINYLSVILFYLFQAIKGKKLQANFKGVAMGDSWVSPVDSCLTWGPYLLNIVSIERGTGSYLLNN